jgi:uncharacterized sporulation protein YeaH/YhbH (DUF444 family)
VDEECELYNELTQDNEEEDDKQTQNRDEYEDYLRYTLTNDDQTSLLFKNILKKDQGFKSFRGRDSVLSGRNSYNSKGRFSSKYGDNRLYLQRLSRNSIDSSTGMGEG